MEFAKFKKLLWEYKIRIFVILQYLGTSTYAILIRFQIHSFQSI